MGGRIGRRRRRRHGATSRDVASEYRIMRNSWVACQCDGTRFREISAARGLVRAPQGAGLRLFLSDIGVNHTLQDFQRQGAVFQHYVVKVAQVELGTQFCFSLFTQRQNLDHADFVG